MRLLVGARVDVGGVPGDRAAGPAVDVDVVDEVGEVHRADVGGKAPAGVVVRLVEDQVRRVAALNGRHHTLGGVVLGAAQRPPPVRGRADVRGARVEALELGVEVRV